MFVPLYNRALKNRSKIIFIPSSSLSSVLCYKQWLNWLGAGVRAAPWQAKCKNGPPLRVFRNCRIWKQNFGNPLVLTF